MHLSIIDWILIALGLVAVITFTTYEVIKFKRDQKKQAEKKANNKAPYKVEGKKGYDENLDD